jgi:hypothetical protein
MILRDSVGGCSGCAFYTVLYALQEGKQTPEAPDCGVSYVLDIIILIPD